MPDFELEDLAGRSWRKQDLLGKPAIIVVWKSRWTGGGEIIQQLYEKLQIAGSASLLVFANGGNPAMFRQSVMRGRYGFPVTPAPTTLVNQVYDNHTSSLWIVDAEGVVRRTTFVVPRSGNVGFWADHVVSEVRKFGADRQLERRAN